MDCVVGGRSTAPVSWWRGGLRASSGASRTTLELEVGRPGQGLPRPQAEADLQMQPGGPGRLDIQLFASRAAPAWRGEFQFRPRCAELRLVSTTQYQLSCPAHPALAVCRPHPAGAVSFLSLNLDLLAAPPPAGLLCPLQVVRFMY